MMKYILTALMMILLSDISIAQNLVLSVTGRVLNELTKEPVGIQLEIYDDAGNRVNRFNSNSKDGYYFATGLKPGKTYFLTNISELGAKEKFFKQQFEIKLPNTAKYQEYSRDISLKPMIVGAELPVKVTPFSPNKSKIRPGAEPVLTPTFEALRENQKVKVEIACYPDDSKNANANIKLTQERCEAIKDYFVSLGINANRLTIKENATTDPKNPPPTKKTAKGKKYKGTTYIIIREI